jgi:hypothetical protein
MIPERDYPGDGADRAEDDEEQDRQDWASRARQHLAGLKKAEHARMVFAGRMKLLMERRAEGQE